MEITYDVFLLTVLAAGVICMPKDREHQGLYDEWKAVPFVDNPNDNQLMGDYGNSEHSNSVFGKYEEIYKKYNKDHDRVIGDELTDDSGKSSGVVKEDTKQTAEKKEDEKVTDIEPQEGGLEDMQKGSQETAQIVLTREDRVSRRRHRKNRELKKKNKKKEKRRRQKRKERKESKKQAEEIEKPEEPTFDDDLQVSMEKFYQEHPDFQKNIGTITDNIIEGSEQESMVEPVVKTEQEEVTPAVDTDLSADDEGMKDVYDDEDDRDDVADQGVADSKSNDASSEQFKHYDYYDENNDSSYSSSEFRAEQEMLANTPSEWFKDHMQNDQPHVDDDLFKEETVQGSTEKDIKESDNVKIASYDIKTDSQALISEDLIQEPQEKSEESKTDEPIVKTDVEPSTSPNPPTPKEDVRVSVTEPVSAQWKERVQTWNLIESQPVESCKEDKDCSAGRICRFSLCLCGQPDFCLGHRKPVCGSDGHLYPSHCELHRTACVLATHIHIDHQNLCMIKGESTTHDVDKYNTDVALETVDKTPANKLIADSTTFSQIQDTKLDLSDSEKRDSFKLDTDGQPPVDIVIDEQNKDADSEQQKSEHVDLEPDNNTVQEGVLTKVIENVIDHETREYPNTQTSTTDDETTTAYMTNDDSYSVDSVESHDLDLNVDDHYDDDDDDTYDDDTYDDDDSNNDQYDDSEEESVAVDDSEVDDDDDDDNDDDDDVYNDDVYDDDDDLYGDDIYDDYDNYNDDDDSDDEDTSFEYDPDEARQVPLYCTPGVYMKFKMDVLLYHCIFFEEQNCNSLTQLEKQRVAAVMFNYFDKDYSGFVEKEELFALQLDERTDHLSSQCTLVDLLLFDELGTRDSRLSQDEFIQAFDLPDQDEFRLELVPLLATVGNGLEIRCDVAHSSDVVWTRNSADLALLDVPGISVLSDGTLFLASVDFHMVGNLTCHDRLKPAIQQVHMLTVQMPPHVRVNSVSRNLHDGNDAVIKCHVEGYPRPDITWMFKDNVITDGPKYRVHNFDDTVTVYNVDYQLDSGEYTCLAQNMAGTSQAAVTITIQPPNTTDTNTAIGEQESFIIFHDGGYTMHEPSECLTQRHVRPDFNNLYFIPDELDSAPSLCQPGVACVWGGAVSVRDMFVYVTQPRENRIVVIDVKDTFNPDQVIFTDHIPVSLRYVAHLDEVWVLCWNMETDGGSKTVVIIRNASRKSQHHAIHTQPIGNRFDLIQDIFLPEDGELQQPYRYGYTVHHGQKGLFKLDLVDKKYTKAVDLTRYDCIPTNVAFVPLGGSVLVQCVRLGDQGKEVQVLTLDYTTDIITANRTTTALPYVSPDGQHVVMVDEKSGKLEIHFVNNHGEIVHQFDVTIGSRISQVTFHKANLHHGYDIYMTLTNSPDIIAVSLDNGKIDTISGGEMDDRNRWLPWFKAKRPLVSGGVFSDFLATTTASSVLVLSARQHNVQCDYRDLVNPVSIISTSINQPSN